MRTRPSRVTCRLKVSCRLPCRHDRGIRTGRGGKWGQEEAFRKYKPPFRGLPTQFCTGSSSGKTGTSPGGRAR